MEQIAADDATRNYFRILQERIDRQYAAAAEARSKGKDASFEVECPPTLDLADRTENIIGPKGVAKRYRELYAEHKGDRNRAIFHLFREIVEGKMGEIPDPEKRLEQAVRTCLVLVTEGVVVAPLDGVPKVKISKNPDGSRYVDIYFAGPIRAAGGTATVFPLILGDYARQLMGLDRYKATNDEVERYVEEISIYDEIITRQYKLKDDDVRKIVRGCPVCVNGEPTEEREVVNYKDLERIPTNRVRGGMCLVISEGVGLKAMKIMSLAKMLGLDWKWLEEVIKIGKSASGKEKEIKPNFTYLSRIAAGRPIFAYPSAFGGFRLRYGRARNTCIMGKGIHPATMFLLDEFIAVGTQTKMERPGKSAEMFPVDSIEAPIVKLASGEVRKIGSVEEALEIRGEVKEILFLGDMLIALGDFRKTAHPLMPTGYCEEWWALELRKALESAGNGTGDAQKHGAHRVKKENGEHDIDFHAIAANPGLVDQNTAIEVSLQLGVPLHPKYLHYYTALSPEEATELVASARKAQKTFAGTEMEELVFGNSPRLKELLEKAGVPHRPENGGITVLKEYAYSLFKTFGGMSEAEPEKGTPALEMLSRISGMTIRDKGGTFIGCRMGRPEAAKPRKMTGDPMVLFPISTAGGNIRSINKAAESAGMIEAEVAYFLNTETKGIEEQQTSASGTRNEIARKCTRCGHFSKAEKCTNCGADTESFSKRKIDVRAVFASAAERLGVTAPPLVKGVKGLINAEKIPEPLEKGILRARQGVHIFRDATIRYELLNAPLTHFKPSEIGLSAEKARELGYKKDYAGRELLSAEQMCEIFPQDMIVNEDAGDFFLRVAKFVDEELEKFYGMPRHYNYDSKEDFVGELFLALAPHTSAAVAARIIGYTKAKVNFAHPYFHLAKRRNCDGDQDSIMLLMDALLNFSKSYLPSTRGGRMDAPLVFTTAINPSEIDDEVYEVETCSEYPLELYEQSLVLGDPEIEAIPTVKRKIGKEGQYTGFGFTHDTTRFDAGPKMSRYVAFKSMEEKIRAQAEVQGKIRAVEKKDALERVLMSHFLPDIIGNARSFSRQVVRCSKCNEKFRRIPLNGRCTKCREETLILTIAQGSVRKYLAIAKELIREHQLSAYLKQRIDLIEREIDSVFTSDKASQKSLSDYA
ncbi:MAG: DNA polymerase II large subunit [Candidatus Diapherotrites archaeon]|uniref:DNA polymerase II large subunit n=1 Tax=Candidatus Iainarchaeum sp. TaxID=3101447 RepID=A0A8T3YND1_9ARCH|nr:DNA polymerase II large subunit [Candidatus Diapherotrites archaeon]